jgi:hypothetical protein
MAHIAFSMQLLVLLVAVALLIWSFRTTSGPGIRLAKIVGSVVILITIFNFACTSYYAIYYWHQGYYKTLMPKVEEELQKLGGGMNIQGSGMQHIPGEMRNQEGEMHKQGDKMNNQKR